MSNTPNIRFKGFADDWEQRKLSDCAGFRRGSFPQPYGNKDWYDGEGAMPFVQVADVANDMKLVDDTKQKISKLAQPMSVCADKGSVLVTLQGSIGRVAITQYKAFVDRTVLIFDQYSEDIDKVFWAYIIKEKFNEEARKAPGGTIKTITKEVLSDFDLTIPNFDEQKKLGKLLVNLDNLITLHQRKCDEVRQLKKFMLQKMFPKSGELIPEIRFAGFTYDWEQRKVTDLLRNSSSAMKIGPFGSALKKEFFVKDGVKVYAQENTFTGDFSIGNYYITEEKYKELQNCELCPGDLVISMMGTIGACAIFPENAEKGIMNSHLLRLQFNERINPKYIMYLLRDSEQIRSQIDKLSVGSIMSGLSSSVVKKLIFPVTNIEEQNKIVDYFDVLDNLIILYQRKCDELKEVKRFMLQNMFLQKG